MTVSRPVNLDECKIQASILLKHLRSTDPEKALPAASRFGQLSHLAQDAPASILANKENIKLKHALAVIALENNFPSWAELKHRMERLDAFRNKNTFTDLYPRRCGGFLNEWKASFLFVRLNIFGCWGLIRMIQIGKKLAGIGSNPPIRLPGSG